MNHSIFSVQAPYRLLRLTGKDARALLHNMSTADFLAGPAEATRETTFVDQKGLLLGWVVVDSGPQEHILVTHTRETTTLKSWLERYIITEDVTVEEWNPDEPLWMVLSDRCAEALTRLQATDPNNSLGNGWQVPGFGPRARILRVPPELASKTLRQFIDADWREATVHEIENARISLGIPAPEHEIDPRTNPWEVRLDKAISGNKGCYIGQEVVARLKNYDKVQRSLVALDLTTSAAPHVGDEIWTDQTSDPSRNIGRVSSVSADPDAPSGYWVLAVIKRSFAIPDQQLMLHGKDGTSFPATVSDRWFWRQE
jgi:folate-binding protein YgfZ